MKKDLEKGERWIFLFLNIHTHTHVKFYHTNVKWCIVVKSCSHVHRTIKAQGARKTEFDFQQPGVKVAQIWRSI